MYDIFYETSSSCYYDAISMMWRAAVCDHTYKIYDLISPASMLHLSNMLTMFFLVVHGARERTVSFGGVGGLRERTGHLGG
jgi:hypothetical protein